MINQSNLEFTKRFFDLFFPENGFGAYSCPLPTDLRLSSADELNLFICGAGAGVLESTILPSLASQTKTLNIAFIDVSPDPLSILHLILQHTSDSKQNIRSCLDTCREIEINKIYKTSINGCDINYAFFIKNLDFNPNPQKLNFNDKRTKVEDIRGNYEDFVPSIINVFKNNNSWYSDNIDVVIMSMLIQHLSYWRSLIAYLNKYLSDSGVFLINEFGMDDYLLGLDLSNAMISNGYNDKELQMAFAHLVRKQFSILSDNNEVCATNIDICKQFFDYWGSKFYLTTNEVVLHSKVSSKFIRDLFLNPMFSPFKKYNDLFGLDSELIQEALPNEVEFNMSFSLRWHIFGKINDQAVYHFDLLCNHRNGCEDILKKLRNYIPLVFEKLALNTTIFSLLKSAQYEDKVLKDFFDLLGRFCLFDFGGISVDQVTIFIKGYDKTCVYPFVNTALCGTPNAQYELLKEIRRYNEELRRSRIPSSNELFFEVYKNVFTGPFVVILGDAFDEKTSLFTDSEFVDGFHFVRLECDNACNSFSCSSKLALSPLSNDVFSLLRNQRKCISGRRCALIPCFRENFGIKNDYFNKEFTSSFVVGYSAHEISIVNQIEHKIIPFFSWLIKTIIDFSGIGTAIDVMRYEHRLLEASTRSAIGSIMSRNGSHNIGSHVLAALTHHVGTMPDDRVLYQYLQQRMDYIATVTTDFPSWGTSTMFVGDMMKTFFSQRHLLEYISGSEGLHAYRFQDPNLGEKERLGQTGKIKLFIRRIRKNINRGDESGEKPDWSLINEAGDHALHFIRYPEKTGIHFIDYKDDSPLPLEHDVALAIPGGVIGEHAFFTILENIIRNAAKHGWGSHSRHADNLEVYIDFIDDPEKDHIQFTIWDNMSDVLKAYNAAADETRKKIDHILHPAEQSNGTKDPHEPLYRKKGEIEALQKAWDDKKIDIKELPLHWQLQLQLNQQLINDRGELRRENWGLAEMRISAGYLQQRSVGQIGGLEPLEKEEEKEAENQAPSGASGQDEEKKNEEDHIILPVAVPGVCTHPDNPNGGIRCSQCTHHGRSDCPIRNNLYHLGYRFKVPKPREMLIVLPQAPTPPGNLPEFKKAGVYFAKADGNGKCSFCDNGEEVKNFNFDYVVFPDEPTAEKCGQKLGKEKIPAECWKSLFPFRLLYCDNLSLSDPQSLKNEVYKRWLEKLKNERGEQRPLTIQLQTEGSDSRGGRGLITDRDLLEFVFRNNFHSVITNLLGSADLSDAPESSRNILKLLACYPSPADEIPQLIGGDICDTIAQTLKRCCGNLRKDYREIGKEHDKAGGIVRDFVASYRAKIVADDDANAVLRDIKPEEFKIQMEMFTGEKPEADDDDFNALDFIFGNRKSAPSDESPFSALVDPAPPVLLRLAKALFAAYQTADTLLRKYEERIVTLPQGYSAGVGSGQTSDTEALNGKLEAVGIELVNSGSPLIKYCRHDKYRGKDTIYAEALSGSQSYLNTLSRITRECKEEHTGTFVKLAENALIRLLIIDERVSNFLKAHPANVSTFDAMNIDVVDVTDKKPEEAITATQNGKNINLESLTLITSGSQSGKKWDMLIIHQGVIDKWFTEHKKEQVGSLIENLTQAVPYTVVTTGRGRPDNIPDWVKILPFSMLESTLFRNYPEKMLLVAAVMNALPNPSEK